MVQIHHSKVLIIGSGPAGYTAAIYASRANLMPRLVQGMQPGGQMTITTDVENYPGFADVIQGPWLMEQMQSQAVHVGTQIHFDLITEIDLHVQPIIAWGDSGDCYSADSVIIATGAQARWLGLDSETQFMGHGVSACATCDGFFFRGKQVAIIGGGNTAVEEALYLTNHAEKVWLVHRRSELRAEKILQERLFRHPKIEPIWNHKLDEVIGDSKPRSVTHARLRSVLTDKSYDLPVSGIFIAIGHTPTTELFQGQLEMDSDGYIITAPNCTATNIPGVFAAGDVCDKIYRQAVTAAGMGCMAALEAERFIAEYS